MAVKRAPKLKAVGKVASAVAGFVPGGSAVKAAVGIAGKLAGARFGGAKRRKTISINKLQKRLVHAKINAKIKRIQLSVFRGL